MTRRIVLQIAVFLLLCIPLLSAVSFLVYSVIPNAHFVILHPVSCVLFLMIGLYGASILHGWHKAQRYWYWASIALCAGVGTWCAVAYLLGLTPPLMILNVAIAPGAVLLFLLVALLMLLTPSALKLGRWFAVGIFVCMVYLICVPYIASVVGDTVWYLVLPLWSAFLGTCALVVIVTPEIDTATRRAPVVRVMLAVLILGVLTTTLIVRMRTQQIQRMQERMFAENSLFIQNEVSTVVDAYSTLAATIANRLEVIDVPTQEQWTESIRDVDSAMYPALAGISYIPRLLKDTTETFPIQYTTAFNRGIQGTPGFDISTDEVRNRTLRTMIDTQAIVATPVMQDTGMFSLYVPLVSEQSDGVRGLVAVMLDRDVLVSQIEDHSTVATVVNVLVGDRQVQETSRIHKSFVSLGGTRWDIVISDMSEPAASSGRLGLILGYSITLALALVILIVYTLLHSRRRRNTNGTFVIEPIKTTVLPVLQALVEEYGGIFAQKKIHFEATIPKRLPLVVADTTVLWIALGSILRNAYQTTPARGTVTLEVKTVSIKRVPQSVVISCIDTGCGYSTQAQKKLFHKASTYIDIERAGGAVESLYTANRMLTATGATLELTSDEGGGATVTVTLPSAVTEAPKVL